MGFHHRKFLTEICEFICNGKQSPSNCSSIKDCNSCFKLCLPNPQFPFFNYPPPPPPPPPPQQEFPPFNDQNQHKLTNYFILTLSIVAFVFFFICIRAICITFRSRRRRLLEVTTERERAPPSVLSASSSMIRQIDENFDESIVDHPIWYIRTLGLNKSVINSISVCNYKKNDGLIEGTECAVCLSEFEEDENLRVLPKCHHAFHLPCIDTWLSSHTNCPMCRASIVSNSTTNPEIARVGSLESVVVVVDDDDDLNSRSLENAQINQVFEEDSVDDETNFDSESRSRVVDEEGEGEGQFEVCENERRVSVVRPRRSVSMDDSFVANVNNALVTVLSIESKDDGDSSRMVFNEDTVSKVDNGDENLAAITKGSTSKSFSFRSTRNLQGVPSPIRRSSSYNGKFLMSGIAAIRRSRRLF